MLIEPNCMMSDKDRRELLEVSSFRLSSSLGHCSPAVASVDALKILFEQHEINFASIQPGVKTTSFAYPLIKTGKPPLSLPCTVPRLLPR